MFLHEEILLLVLRDREGTVEFGANYLHALGGAMLAELLLAERIGTREDGKKKLVEVISAEPLGEPVIDECLATVGASGKPRTLEHWVSKFANMRDLKHRVAATLCARGVLRADEDKVLLIFTRKIYPEIDPAPEQAITERLREAIFTDTDAVSPRTAVLLSLANGADLLKFSFDRKQLKDRKTRIEQVVNGEVAGAATGEAIDEAIQAAMMTALLVTVIIPTVITTTATN